MDKEDMKNLFYRLTMFKQDCLHYIVNINDMNSIITALDELQSLKDKIKQEIQQYKSYKGLEIYEKYNYEEIVLVLQELEKLGE